MSFITCNYNKNLIYAFVYWAVEIFLRSLIYLDWKLFQVYKKDSINEYFYIILMNISDLLSGFLVMYTQCSIKEKQNNDYSDVSSKKSKIQLISEDKIMAFYVNQKFISKIIAICILDLLNRSTFYIFYQTNPKALHNDISHKAQFDIINHIDIIARFLLSIYLLKAKIFKHHKLSFFIILVGFLILIPTDAISLHFNQEGKDEKLTYIYIGVFSFKSILLPLQDIIQKKVFIENYVLPEYLMILRGLGEMVLMIIITPVLYYTLWINDNENFELATDTKNMILLILIYVISTFIKSYVLLKVIYYFSAQSVSFLIISESITGSITEIVNFFKEPKSDYSQIIVLLIDIIVILITSFGTFVYNEIIVIKKWELDLNVASEITSRSLKEIYKIKLDDEEDDDDEDEDEDTDGEKKPVELNDIYE